MNKAIAREEIERRAEQVLARVPEWIWDGARLPVPVEDIADSCCGLLVRDVDDLTTAPGAPELDDGQALSGLLLPQLGEIWVNAAEATEWPPRRRFTIGHELGHWYMHRDIRTGVFCRPASIEANDGDGRDAGGGGDARGGRDAGGGRGAARREIPAPRPPREEEANFFAAALLMPAHLVERHYRRTDGNFELLCSMFGSSGAAMGRRLHAVIKPGS